MSTTERFSVQEFESALSSALDDTDLTWKKAGYVQNELRYRVFANDTGHGVISVEINSSIDKSGYAQAQGENSIRIWLDAGETPIGNKVQRWVTRLPGWQKRLKENVLKAIDMAQLIEWCPKCKSLEKVFVVHKEGPNKGRLFLRCNCPKSFTWLDEVEDEEPVKPVKADAKRVPSCPRCGGQMILRHRKDGTGDFWGCRLFPACRGTREVEEAVEAVEPALTGKDYGMPEDDFQKMVKELDPERKFDEEIQRRDREDEERAQREKAQLETDAVYPEEWKRQQGESAPESAEPKKFSASKYQLAIFSWTTKWSKSRESRTLVVEAGPGCGKTRTLTELLPLIPRSLDVCYLAFNKHTVADMRQKAEKKGLTHIKIRTDHSLGFAACRAAFGNDLKVDKHKVDAILEGMLPRDQFGYLYSPIKKLVSLVKANLLGTSREELLELVTYHNIDLNGETEVVFMTVAAVVAKCLSITSVVDYDDQVWLPVVLNLPCHQHDMLLVDEAQDTNKSTTALFLKSIKPNGKIIAVGDRHQSLYGFRGADAEAIPNLIKNLDADVLPLSISYRLPKSHVRDLNQMMPSANLESPDWAIEGVIRNLSVDKALVEWKSGDMVLCRTNAPLVKPAFQLIRRGVKAIIRGRDIGSGLLDLVKKMKAGSLVELLVSLRKYETEEVAKLVAADKGLQAQNLEDKVETIIALADGITSITALEERIDKIFSDENDAGVIFSSVHRAKGLEAERVYILHRELMPHPMAKQPWEKVQEENCMYVAHSRSLNEKIYVS